MTDYVYQCDYCGQFVSTVKAYVFYVPQRELDDGTVLAIPGTYCSTYCGERSADICRTTSRG